MEVPEDICVGWRTTSSASGPPRGPRSDGPIVKVNVRPVDCRDVARPVAEKARCWEVIGKAPVLADGQGSAIGAYYFQAGDGRIFEDTGRSVSN